MIRNSFDLLTVVLKVENGHGRRGRNATFRIQFQNTKFRGKQREITNIRYGDIDFGRMFEPGQELLELSGTDGTSELVLR
jgi:hypothetical protein